MVTRRNTFIIILFACTALIVLNLLHTIDKSDIIVQVLRSARADHAETQESNTNQRIVNSQPLPSVVNPEGAYTSPIKTSSQNAAVQPSGDGTPASSASNKLIAYINQSSVDPVPSSTVDTDKLRSPLTSISTAMSTRTTSPPVCSLSIMEGQVAAPINQADFKLEDLANSNYYNQVRLGGRYEPSCTPTMKVAIIVPFRNRELQLRIFLRHMHPFLQKQNLYYQIFVVEQNGTTPFNRASLFNIGFVQALKNDSFNCFIFHDVDLLPEDLRNYYGCPTSPRHMSVAVDKFNYQLPYATIFGGVSAFQKEHFEKINGFSNLFWGWGGEDDDLFGRIQALGYSLTRPSIVHARYTMVQVNHHQSTKANPNRMRLLENSGSRLRIDGLSVLHYDILASLTMPLYTRILVHIDRYMYDTNDLRQYMS